MPDRDVTQTGKNSEGDITKLCNPGKSWSPRLKDDAISDIDSGTHRYYVNVDGNEVNVIVVDSGGGQKHLRTSPDETEKNNLDELPNCP